jgi:hypothetical protein
MDVIEQNAQSVSEALKNARQYWLTYYGQAQSARSRIFCTWKLHRKYSNNLLWGAGSLINLFPNTHYNGDDFRCWHASIDDAWSNDWYNVGADLYEAMSKAQVELINAGCSEPRSNIPATR